jgi:transcriptional regulator with XRE-family HTH domain
MDKSIAFGFVIRSLRKSRNISQEKLADSCDLDRTYISLLERGLRQPSLSTIFSLADALSSTPSELIKLVEEVVNENPTNRISD